MGRLCAKLCVLLLAGASSLAALTAELAVAQREVYVGEPFLVEVVVDGDDSPEQPSLAKIDGFRVEERGGQAQNSTSVTIINGRIDRQVKRGYVFRYLLIAERTGRLTIPALTVRGDGATATTRPVSIAVRTPEETDDFKLRLSLSKREVYVGEPVTLTAHWYIGDEVKDFTFSMPLLTDDRLVVIDDDPRVDPARKDEFITVQLGRRQAIGRKERTMLDGQQFLTVSFRKVLIPKEPGRIKLPQTLVSLVTSGPVRSRSVWDDFFSGTDVFNRGRRTTRRIVVPANELAIAAKELPSAGKPARYSGLVGEFSLSASATPTSVSVGEPLTLEVRVQGPRYLGNVLLPPLAEQPSIARDFRVPADRATGLVENGAKVFTQKLRAMHSGVNEVPPIELPYFDPVAGKYAVARSEPIPLDVTGTNIITARDAEGSSENEIETTPIETQEEGISYNYEDAGALVDEGDDADGVGGFGFASVVAAPPLVFGLVWTAFTVRRRMAGLPRRRSGLQAREFEKRLRATGADAHEGVFEAAREYLAATFGLSAAALTFGDIEPRLVDAGLAEGAIADWRELFARCEAARFGGAGAGGEDLTDLARRAVAALEAKVS